VKTTEGHPVVSASRNNDRITTGIDALDHVLDGGIPRYSVVFVVGAPGAGKTVLCHQALFANAARSDSRVLYIGTLSEPVVKMVRYASEFSFFHSDLVGNEVIYADLGSATDKTEIVRRLDELVKQYRPEFLVIDSFKALREHCATPAEFRDFAAELMTRLASWEVTAFFVGEYAHEDILHATEFSIADGILYLYGTDEPHRQQRHLRVMKMRGSSFFPGEHYFEITSDGIRLYPRMEPSVTGPYQTSDERIPSAIEGLSEAMEGGLHQGTSALIVGGAGSGKTLAALSFVIEAARAGKPGLFVTFEEDEGQLTRNTEAFGWDLRALREQGLIEIYHVSPSELDLDKHAVIFKDRAEQLGARLVVIDTITAMESSDHGPGKYPSYLWAIVDHFKRLGTSIILTYETAPEEDFPQPVVRHTSFIADAMLSTRLVTRGTELQRLLTVLKIRGSNHDHTVHAYHIQAPQISIGRDGAADS
jgi:circadian clock protein KaiC